MPGSCRTSCMQILKRFTEIPHRWLHLLLIRLQAVLITLKYALCWVVLPGGDYTEMGLAATTVASSFGKVILYWYGIIRNAAIPKLKYLYRFVVLRHWLFSFSSGLYLNISIKISVFAWVWHWVRMGLGFTVGAARKARSSNEDTATPGQGCFAYGYQQYRLHCHATCPSCWSPPNHVHRQLLTWKSGHCHPHYCPLITNCELGCDKAYSFST